MSPPGKRRHNELNAAPPPENPGERARRERQPTETTFTAEKVSVFGQNLFVRRAARHDPYFGFPLRAAKQGRGNESVSGGDREPRLTEPQRDSCQRQLTDEV